MYSISTQDDCMLKLSSKQLLTSCCCLTSRSVHQTVCITWPGTRGTVLINARRHWEANSR